MPARDRRAGRPQEWTTEELNRLLASARTMPGHVGEIPAKHFWPALVLTFLDTAVGTRDLMTAPKSAYDHVAGTLTAGMLVYQLHPVTIEALDAIRRHDEDLLFPWQADPLFPWPLDTPAGPHYMLYRNYKRVLYRANLPHVKRNLFERLRVTARRVPDVLDRIDPKLTIVPREGKLRFPRALEKRRWTERVPHDRETKSGRMRARKTANDVYRLQPAPGQPTLAAFLEEMYIPLRLTDASILTRDEYRQTVNKFGWFLACEPTFHHLSDDHVQRFLVWLKAAGSRENVTCNKKLTMLLALWRFAWKKRRVDELPRDVTKLKEPKLVARAWTLDEFERILRAADTTEGDVCGIPAATFWVALLLTLHYTGFRIGATLQLRGEDFDPETGTIDIPAQHQKQRAQQVLRLPTDAADAIRAMGDASVRERLFPWPYGVRILRERFKLIVAWADVPVTGGEAFHKIRKTSASYLARDTDERTAQEHLSHLAASVTKRYLDPRIVRKQHTSEMMQRPNWRGPDEQESAEGIAWRSSTAAKCE